MGSGRRWRWTVFASLIVSAVVLALTQPAMAVADVDRPNAAGAGDRAMWLWSRADPAEVVTWAQGNNVKEIFAYVATDIATNGDLPRLQQLKTRCDAAGIKLAALGGEPSWTTNHTVARAWLKATAATGLFYAHHVDVEPYALNSWTTDQNGTTSAFLAMLSTLQASDSRALEADVPFWYESITIPGGGNLADATLARVNAVTVMSYRDTATGANSMTAVGADMLTRASAAGKDVRLGAETQNLPDCTHCTFYEEGRAHLESTLTEVDLIAQSYSRYKGIAIHHYNSWTMLKP